MARKTVCIDIAGPQFIQKESVDIPLLCDLPEIDHDRQSGKVARLDCVLDGWPAWARIVRRLESHDDVRVLFGAARGGFGVHPRGIVFLAGTHARCGNIQECQYTRARALDDAIAEIREVLEAG